MKLSQLIKTNNWLSVKLTLLQNYPDQKKSIEAYKNVYEKLALMEIGESDMIIELKQVNDEEESYVEVSGKKETNDKKENSDSFALDFTLWKEWLAMSISNNALKEFNELEIIAHCLWEMTFMGYDEKIIQKELSSLKKSIEELENMTDEERKANTKSMDDFLKELDDK